MLSPQLAGRILMTRSLGGEERPPMRMFQCSLILKTSKTQPPNYRGAIAAHEKCASSNSYPESVRLCCSVLSLQALVKEYGLPY